MMLTEYQEKWNCKDKNSYYDKHFRVMAINNISISYLLADMLVTKCT